MKRSVTIISVGLVLFAAAVAAEVLTQPRGWVRTIAFVAWCVAAFGGGMYYREFVQRARQRRGNRPLSRSDRR